MIENMFEVFKGWNEFFQFASSVFVLYFVFYILSDIFNQIFIFINETLPILLRGYPPDIDFSQFGDESELEESKKEDKK